MSSPRTALAEIRNAIDDMMERGEIHITTGGVRIDLRELLGKCDTLKRFLDVTIGAPAANEQRLCPICGRDALLPDGICEACGANLGGVNMDLVRAARERLNMGAEFVWENECQLVFDQLGFKSTGEMGLCYPDMEPPGEVQVAVRLSHVPDIIAKLQGVPVRITIQRVPGGNR